LSCVREVTCGEAVEKKATTYSWYIVNVKYTSTTVHKQNWERAISGLITHQLRNASFTRTAQRRLYYMYLCSGTTTHTLLPSITFVNASAWHEVYERVQLHDSCVHSLHFTCLKIIEGFRQNPLLDITLKTPKRLEHCFV
jgi:transglutaminase/protease-like cytokinesis protein 3